MDIAIVLYRYFHNSLSRCYFLTKISDVNFRHPTGKVLTVSENFCGQAAHLQWSKRLE